MQSHFPQAYIQHMDEQKGGRIYEGSPRLTDTFLAAVDQPGFTAHSVISLQRVNDAVICHN